jgi:predicted membrane-bound spermidine synthase
LLMGFSFPLANAVIQRAESSVGRRAGILYLANTAGAVCGSLAAGFVLLPMAGLQLSATILMCVAALSVVPLYLATSPYCHKKTKLGTHFAVGGTSTGSRVVTRAYGASLGSRMRCRVASACRASNRGRQP